MTYLINTTLSQSREVRYAPCPMSNFNGSQDITKKVYAFIQHSEKYLPSKQDLVAKNK